MQSGGIAAAEATLSLNALICSLNKSGPYERVFHTLLGFYGASDQPFLRALENLCVEHRRAIVYLSGPTDGRHWVENKVAQLVHEGVLNSAFLMSAVDPETQQVVHVFDFYKAALSVICQSPMSLELQRLPIPDVDTLRLPERYICINVGCSTPCRKYPVELLADFAGRMLQNGLSIILLGGGRSDEADAEALLNYLHCWGIETANLISLVKKSSHKSQMLAALQAVSPDIPPILLDILLIKKALFTVTNDTGVAHLAHCVGGRMLVLTINWHAKTCFPYPPTHDMSSTRVLWQKCCEHCSPDTQYACQYWNSPKSALCIASIGVDNLLNAGQDWLEEALGSENLIAMREPACPQL